EPFEVFALLLRQFLSPVIIAICNQDNASFSYSTEHRLLGSRVNSNWVIFNNPTAAQLRQRRSSSTWPPVNLGKGCFLSLLVHNDDCREETKRNKHQRPQHW